MRTVYITGSIILIVAGSFSTHAWSVYFNSRAPEKLIEVSGVVDKFVCRYFWPRVQTAKISLKNNDTLYKIVQDIRNCETYEELIKTNSKITMKIDSHNSILELISENQIIFTYADWKNAYKGEAILWTIIAFSELLLLLYIYVKHRA